MKSHLLTHTGDVFINFKNGTYQWVSIKRFQLPDAGVDDPAALALLIAHDLYGDAYAGGVAGDSPTLHGSYRRDRITVDCFDPTDAAAEETRLRAWAEQYEVLPEHLRADLETEMYRPLHDASSVHRLRDLGETAFHDWGGVHDEFRELVLINRTTGTLTLVVAADD